MEFPIDSPNIQIKIFPPLSDNNASLDSHFHSFDSKLNSSKIRKAHSKSQEIFYQKKDIDVR